MVNYAHTRKGCAFDYAKTKGMMICIGNCTDTDLRLLHPISAFMLHAVSTAEDTAKDG